MKNKFGNEVAAEMDRILQDKSFTNVFASPVSYEDALMQDPSYRAFVRIAGLGPVLGPPAPGPRLPDPSDPDQDKVFCEKCGGIKYMGKCPKCYPPEDSNRIVVPGDDKPAPLPVPPGMPAPGPGTPEPPVGPLQAAAAIEYIIDNLLRTSVALENLNLKRSAAITIAIANGIIKEAAHEMGGDESLFDDVDEDFDPKVNLGDENDEPEDLHRHVADEECGDECEHDGCLG